MKIFDFASIEQTAGIDQWIGAMEVALKTCGSDSYLMPARMHLDLEQNTYLLMPCISRGYWSTKLVSFCPDNQLIDKPSIYGMVVLNNAETGEPLAIMDGRIITAMRTAAVSAAGLKVLAPSGIQTLGIVGTGFQGIYQAVFACRTRNIEQIWAYDRSIEAFKVFKATLAEKYPGIHVVKADDANQVAMQSEVIITATNTQQPVFDNRKDLFLNKTFIGVGSYKPDCREFPEELFKSADQLFIDTEDGLKESGDLIAPVKNGWIAPDNIYPISKLLNKQVPLSENNTRIYKTVGCAIFDLFAAKLIYEIYKKNKS